MGTIPDLVFCVLGRTCVQFTSYSCVYCPNTFVVVPHSGIVSPNKKQLWTTSFSLYTHQSSIHTLPQALQGNNKYLPNAIGKQITSSRNNWLTFHETLLWPYCRSVQPATSCICFPDQVYPFKKLSKRLPKHYRF